jgi:hypothetical protein
MAKGNGNNGATTKEESTADVIMTDELRARFRGAHLALDDIKAEDGRLAQAASQSNKNIGVINTVISPTDEFNAIILRVGGKDGRMLSEAYYEALSYDLKDQMEYIKTRAHVEAANKPSNLILKGLQALTHTSFTATANNFSGKMKSWWNKNKDSDGGLKNDNFDN